MNRGQNLLVVLEVVVDIAEENDVDGIRGQVGGIL